MKKVIVTGASGFIGRHALKTLISKGFEVHAITSNDSRPANSDCKWHRVNLLENSQIKDLIQTVKPTDLLHFAWYVVPGQYLTSEYNFMWLQASLELLRQFQERGGQRVVMAGTCFEYDLKYGYCSELVTPIKPDSPYGTCKHALQELLRVYSQMTGLSSAWGRIFFLYGKREHPQRLVSSVIRSLLGGDPALCSHGNQIRDFLYVQDVADAFVALLESEITGVVNIASGKPVSIKEVVYKIGEKFGHPEMIRLGAIPASPQEQKLLVGEVGRLSNEVGWLPKYDLDTGLELTIDWWKSIG